MRLLKFLKRGRSLFFVYIFLLFNLVLPSTSLGQASSILTEQEQAWLAGHPEIRLAPDPDFLPIEYFDNKGRYVGIAADYIALIEKKLGIQLKRVQLDNWQEVLDKSRQRKVDLWGAATPTPQRLEYMMFTQSFLELPAVILVRKTVEKDLTLKNLKGMKVAVISGYGIHDHIVNRYPEIKLDVVPNIKAGLKKVSFGMVDAMVANIAMATHYIEEEGISNLRVAGESGFVYKWAFASRKDWPELNGILGKALAEITEQERLAIHYKWIHLEDGSWEKFRKRMFVGAAVVILLCFVAAFIYHSLKNQVRRRTSELNEELTRRISIEQALLKSQQENRDLFDQFHIIVKETSATLGEEFFRSLAQHLSSALKVKYAFVGEMANNKEGQVKTLAFYPEGSIPDSMHYDLKDTPCEIVSNGEWAWYPRDVQSMFSKDKFLVDFGIESYFGVPLKNSTGTVIGHLVVMDDKPMEDIETHKMIMTVFASRALAELERRNIDHELVKAKNVAEQASLAKSKFLSQMSHELRTPMNSILGFSQLMLMKDEILDEDYKDCLEQISRAGEHLMELIEEVLDLSHIESGRLKMKQEKVEIHSNVSKAVGLVLPLAKDRRIRVINNISNQIQINFLGDALRFQQVLINLLSNAVKYNVEGGSITLDAESDQNHTYRVLVKDTGVGIPQEKLKCLFEPFERLGAELTGVAGTGIGLAFSQRLMKMMNGSIYVESIPGEGSCFIIEIPLFKENAPYAFLQ